MLLKDMPIPTEKISEIRTLISTHLMVYQIDIMVSDGHMTHANKRQNNSYVEIKLNGQCMPSLSGGQVVGMK